MHRRDKTKANQVPRNITIHYRTVEKKYLEKPNKEITCDINKHILKAQLKPDRKFHTAVSHAALSVSLQQDPEAQFRRNESSLRFCTAHRPPFNNPQR